MSEANEGDMWQSRTVRLLGHDGVERLRCARVLVMGVGGVGSWAAEALVRSSVGHITIVDADCVAPSNINRQLMATTQTVGERKVDALRRRLLEINPSASVEALDMEYNESTAGEIVLEDYDCVIDAIDSIACKALLICEATRRKVALFSSMGAALKLDPSRIRSGKFTDVTGCRLAAALRRRFKRTGVYPARRFMCVWSDEMVPNRGMDDTATADTSMSYGKVSYNGSMCHITAIFGMTLAGMCVRHLINFDKKKICE
ncbi:MAG: tRNA threonylcarbamoyladenosine dehydratase [Paramuribaculum sp.]|nr:tRNA threonylcarbamoyladenosine dehydratase [Paramuribaculum sp.]